MFINREMIRLLFTMNNSAVEHSIALQICIIDLYYIIIRTIIPAFSRNYINIMNIIFSKSNTSNRRIESLDGILMEDGYRGLIEKQKIIFSFFLFRIFIFVFRGLFILFIFCFFPPLNGSSPTL